MKWQSTPRFESDWKALPREHRQLFRDALPAFSRACDEFVTEQGKYRWPASLRVSPLRSAPGIWEMTWSFTGPDGRATFQFVQENSAMYVRWRRIGNHEVFKQP